MSEALDFDEIRPFTDEETPSVVAGLMANESFMNLARALFPGDEQTLLSTLQGIEKTIDFQGKIVYPPVKQMLSQQSDGLSSSGFDALDPKGSYLFISNHRDIILDSALLNYLLFENGFNTTEIAIGNRPKTVVNEVRIMGVTRFPAASTMASNSSISRLSMSI